MQSKKTKALDAMMTVLVKVQEDLQGLHDDDVLDIDEATRTEAFLTAAFEQVERAYKRSVERDAKEAKRSKWNRTPQPAPESVEYRGHTIKNLHTAPEPPWGVFETGDNTTVLFIGNTIDDCKRVIDEVVDDVESYKVTQ